MCGRWAQDHLAPGRVRPRAQPQQQAGVHARAEQVKAYAKVHSGTKAGGSVAETILEPAQELDPITGTVYVAFAAPVALGAVAVGAVIDAGERPRKAKEVQQAADVTETYDDLMRRHLTLAICRYNDAL